MTGAPITGAERTVGGGEESSITVKGLSAAGDGVMSTVFTGGGMVMGGGARYDCQTGQSDPTVRAW
jgi:hypothetical protein